MKSLKTLLIAICVSITQEQEGSVLYYRQGEIRPVGTNTTLIINQSSPAYFHRDWCSWTTNSQSSNCSPFNDILYDQQRLIIGLTRYLPSWRSRYHSSVGRRGQNLDVHMHGGGVRHVNLSSTNTPRSETRVCTLVTKNKKKNRHISDIDLEDRWRSINESAVLHEYTYQMLQRVKISFRISLNQHRVSDKSETDVWHLSANSELASAVLANLSQSCLRLGCYQS